MSNIDNNITPAQLLTAAREGHITAVLKDAQTLEPLAGGDGPEQYPACTIALLANGEEIREVQAWKLVYYSTEGDTLNGGRGTYDFRNVRSDCCTCGDAEVKVDDGDGENMLEIIISTGEGMPSVGVISVDGLTAEEAEEIREAIESAIEEVYSDWTPGHPDEDEIYTALVGKKRETTTIDADVAGEEISVKLYAGTHCGKPQYAYEGDESETVYEDEDECAKAAREHAEVLIEAEIERVESIGEKEYTDEDDYRVVTDFANKTVTVYGGDDILENHEAMADVSAARRSGFGRDAKWVNAHGCSVDNDAGWQWDVTGHGLDLDDHEEALDKEEREAAEMLREALTDRD